ncbi:MAG: hypothetical protein K2W82_05690 [Candidatus Obscuribacterales bacterium]|nr:hypothetical protein [Candidatus Obscuribacterales bacterium]
MKVLLLAVFLSSLFINQARAADTISTLGKVNEEFHSLYSEAKKAIASKLGPVILLSDGKATLLNEGEEETVSYVPQAWNRLKEIDHLPLAIFVALAPYKEKESAFDQALERKLTNLKELAGKIQAGMSELNLSPLLLKRQEQIVSYSIAYLSELLNGRQINPEKLGQFINKVSTLSLLNADDACALELASLDGQIQIWRQKLGPKKWHLLHVVVSGGHMARQEERTCQYFQLLLKQKGEGQRLIYLEGGGDREKALDLLSTHILDQSISQAYFHTSGRMHKDLLADGAKLYLKKHRLQTGKKLGSCPN